MPYLATLASITFHGLGLAAAKPKTSSSATSILILVVIVGIGYFLLIRPQRQRARKAQQQNQNVGVGDEVMLSSGIFGRVTGIEGDRASVEIAPDIEIEVVMRAIAQRVAPADVASEPELVSPDPANDEDEDFAHASDDPGAGHDGADGADGQLIRQDEPGSGATAWPPTAVKPAADDPGGSAPAGGTTGDGSTGGGLSGEDGSGTSRRPGRETG
jgi:preprotein translocase subunit YajC